MSEQLPQQILRLPGVVKMTGLSRSTIYKFISAGAFPAPIRLGPRAIGFRRNDVEAWLASRDQGLRRNWVKCAIAGRLSRKRGGRSQPVTQLPSSDVV